MKGFKYQGLNSRKNNDSGLSSKNIISINQLKLLCQSNVAYILLALKPGLDGVQGEEGDVNGSPGHTTYTVLHNSLLGKSNEQELWNTL